MKMPEIQSKAFLSLAIMATTISFSQTSIGQLSCSKYASDSYSSYFDETTQWNAFINWEGVHDIEYDPEKFTLTFCNDAEQLIFSKSYYGEGGKIPYIDKAHPLPGCNNELLEVILFYEMNIDNDPKRELLYLYNVFAFDLMSREKISEIIGLKSEIEENQNLLRENVYEICENNKQ